MYHQRRKRGLKAPISEEDLSSCMKNALPGSPGEFCRIGQKKWKFRSCCPKRRSATCHSNATRIILQLDLAIMSFEGGFHGRLFGSLSTTHTKALHKVDIPAFANWVSSPFPNLKYPLDQHEAENAKEETRCLAAAEKKMKNSKTPIAALIVEPIQSEGGDNHASSKFFQGLRDLTKKHDILMIVDEVQTGVGATGDFWAHEAWNLTVSREEEETGLVR